MNVLFFDLFIYGHRRTVSLRVSSEWPALLDLVPDLRSPEEETTSHTGPGFDRAHKFRIFRPVSASLRFYLKDSRYLDSFPLL